MTKKLTPAQRVNRASGKVAAPKPTKPVPDPKPKKRAVQSVFAGVIEDKDPELTEDGLALVDLQTRRMDLAKLEKEQRTKIHDKLVAKGLRRYHDPEAKLLLEIITAEEKVKVHCGGKDQDSDDDESEE